MAISIKSPTNVAAQTLESDDEPLPTVPPPAPTVQDGVDNVVDQPGVVAATANQAPVAGKPEEIVKGQDASVAAAAAPVLKRAASGGQDYKISGDEMLTVLRAAADHGQVTLREREELARFVTATERNLSPEAKAAYEAFLHAAPASALYAGKDLQAGLKAAEKIAAQPAEEQLRGRDSSLAAAMDRVGSRIAQGGHDFKVSGEEMMTMLRAAADHGQITPQERAELTSFMTEAKAYLGPEAKAAYEAFMKAAPTDGPYDGKALAAGLQGAEKIAGQAREEQTRGHDASVGQAISPLQSRIANEGHDYQVSGEDFQAVLGAAADHGGVTLQELADIEDFVKANWQSLSPEARAAYADFQATGSAPATQLRG